MASKNKKIVGLLNASATIKRFKFNKKKFLEGMTETEFINLTEVVQADKDHYFKCPENYKKIIESLRESNTLTNTLYLGYEPLHKGTSDDVVFCVYAHFVEYNANLNKLVEKLSEVSLPYAHGSSSCDFLGVNLGRTEIRKHVSDGHRSPLLGNTENFDPKTLKTSKKLHEIIFSSLDHGGIVRGYDLRCSIAYQAAVTGKNVDESSVKYKEQATVKIGKGHITLIKLSFDVNATIQYQFKPSLDDPTFKLADTYKFKRS